MPLPGQELDQPGCGVPVAGFSGVAVEVHRVPELITAVGVVGKAGGVIRMVVVDEGLPDRVGQRGGAPNPLGVLVQEIRHGVPGDAAHPGRHWDQCGSCAVQRCGGVSQGIVKPVGGSNGLLSGGEVGGCGRAQEVGGERSGGSDAAGVERGGDDRLAVALVGGGVLPMVDQRRPSGQHLREPRIRGIQGGADAGSAASLSARRCSSRLSASGTVIMYAKSSSSRSLACGSG
jgi:hypothetical protein